MTTAAIVEDHPLVRDGLVELLTRDLGYLVVYSGDNIDDIFALRPLPDVVILDLDLPGGTVSPSTVGRLGRRGCPVLVYSAMATPSIVRELLMADVPGLVSKRESTQTLAAAIKQVVAGGTWTSPDVASAIAGDASRPRFSDQEERALILYATGLTLPEVATRLGIAPATAATYIKRVRAKYAELGRKASTKTDLHREASRDGIIGQ